MTRCFSAVADLLAKINRMMPVCNLWDDHRTSVVCERCFANFYTPFRIAAGINKDDLE